MAGATHIATMGQVRRAIGRRAVAICALECGMSKDQAAARVGVSRNMLNRYLRPGWEPRA